jgi:hypothetical protein
MDKLIEAAQRVVAGKIAAGVRTRLVDLRDIRALESALKEVSEPRKHDYYGAGETDCPSEIKAPNGELHTLRCRNCGKDNPRGACES